MRNLRIQSLRFNKFKWSKAWKTYVVLCICVVKRKGRVLKNIIVMSTERRHLLFQRATAIQEIPHFVRNDENKRHIECSGICFVLFLRRFS
jgi:hypothetical protein